MSILHKIPQAEWDRIMELACLVVNRSVKGRNTEKATASLRRYLVKLIKRYGRRADLVDILASYARDSLQAITLMKEAYCTASEWDSQKDKTMISASILESYLENGYPHELCSYWANQLERNMLDYSDEYYNELYLSAMEKLARMGSS